MDSWYVQEAGEQLLQDYLDKLSMQRGDLLQEQQTAWAAMKLAEELRGNTSSTRANKTTAASTSEFLRHQQLRYKAAKLRLFLVPDPRESIQELQQVLLSLSSYFSEDNALIVGLNACLANAMM